MKKTRSNSLRNAGLCFGLSAMLLAACGNKDSAPTGAATPSPGNSASPTPASAGAPAPAAPASGASASAAPIPPVTVSTVAVEQKDLAVRLRATGMVSPINSVDIKAQTNSIIAKVHVRDGQFVKNGDLLFTLDARTEEANIVKAQAQLDKDAASLADAQRQLKRTQELAAQNFIAQGQVDTAMANTQVWTATVSADKAAIDAARVAQSYARILAPQSGRIGTVNVSNGATVQANVSNLLTITQVNPIAVTFTLPQRNITDALAALKAGGAPVTATLADNVGIFKGKLQFVDSQIDVASGSVKAKAYFKNDEEKLWPGAFVEVQQTLREIKDALVIPQAAVIYSARGPFVYAVENGKAVARPLKIVQAQGAEIAVTGVTLGEPIIVEGKQNVRPGAPVVERSKDAAKDPKAAASSPEAPASKASAP